MPFSLLKSAPDTAGAPTRWAWRQGDVRQKWAGMKRLRCHRISQFPQALDEQGEPRGRQRQPQSAVTQQQAAGDGGNPEQGQHQQRGLQAIEPAMPRAGSLRVAPITMALLGFPRRPGHSARAAASKSPRGPASRLRAPRSWRGWSPGRGSRTCAPGRSARSGSPS